MLFKVGGSNRPVTEYCLGHWIYNFTTVPFPSFLRIHSSLEIVSSCFLRLQPELILNTSAHPQGFLTLILWAGPHANLRTWNRFKNSISVPTHNFQENRYTDILVRDKTGTYALPPASTSFLITSFLLLFSTLSEMYQPQDMGKWVPPDGHCQSGNSYHQTLFANDHIWCDKMDVNIKFEPSRHHRRFKKNRHENWHLCINHFLSIFCNSDIFTFH